MLLILLKESFFRTLISFGGLEASPRLQQHPNQDDQKVDDGDCGQEHAEQSTEEEHGTDIVPRCAVRRIAEEHHAEEERYQQERPQRQDPAREQRAAGCARSAVAGGE